MCNSVESHFIAEFAFDIWRWFVMIIFTKIISIWWTLLVQALFSKLIPLFFVATKAIFFIIESTVNAVASIYVERFWLIALKAFFKSSLIAVCIHIIIWFFSFEFFKQLIICYFARGTYCGLNIIVNQIMFKFTFFTCPFFFFLRLRLILRRLWNRLRFLKY